MKNIQKEMNSIKKILTGSSSKNFVGVAIILCIFLFLHIVNQELRTLALIIVIGGVIHLVTGNEYEAVIGAVLFGIVYNLPSLLKSMHSKSIEGLDEAADGKKNIDNKDNDENIDEDEDVVELIEKLESDLENAKKHDSAANANEEELNKLSEKKELNMNDFEHKKIEQISGTKQADLQTPAGAQRETFRLINTVEQLQNTIKELAPTLKSGRKIIEAYEKLTFRKE